jgi:hypothetical protein
MKDKQERTIKMFDVDASAQRLFSIFVDNIWETVDDTLITYNGLLEMTEFFDEVPVECRVEVFKEFLNKLKTAGYKYDIHQFLEMSAGK